jgi:hypothetical protein
MTPEEITTLRLYNQNISEKRYTDVAELVKWMVAFQSQDYTQSKWALGARLDKSSDAEIEKAFEERKIIRSWPLRGTIHITAAEDLHWINELIGPGMIVRAAGRNKQLELDEKIYNKSLKVIAGFLEGQKQSTREEISEELARYRIYAEGVRLSHILQRAGLENLLSYGQRRGKDFTYTLLDDRVGKKNMVKEDALAELAGRYINSRGPASLADFTWWSGLSAPDARKAFQLVKEKFIEVKSGNDVFLLAPEIKVPEDNKDRIFLLPAFEEYLLAYKDRSACLENGHFSKVISNNGIFNPIIVFNGKVIGIWKRTITKNKVSVNTQLFVSLKTAQKKAVKEEAEKFADFLNLKLDAEKLF